MDGHEGCQEKGHDPERFQGSVKDGSKARPVFLFLGQGPGRRFIHIFVGGIDNLPDRCEGFVKGDIIDMAGDLGKGLFRRILEPFIDLRRDEGSGSGFLR